MANRSKPNVRDVIERYLRANKVKCIIVVAFLLFALLGLIISKGVKINYNLSDYLSKDTETSIALDIMTEEFGMSGNVQVMLTGIDKATAKEVKQTLSSIEGTLNVSFDEDSPTSYKEDTQSALFNILVDGEDHSDTAKYVINEIKNQLGDKYGAVELGGSTIEYNALRENTAKEMGLIIVLCIAMAAVLLLITASSWIEPLILLACSGIAIAINMGLNIFLGEISYITNSVSSILQLALSVDYSIVLLHAYRDEKKHISDNTVAMRNAVKMVLNPVSASALTTIAGLVALLFMSFTIGFDIGIVLIKGIVVSAATALTLLPVVVLMLDPLLEKTLKRPFVPNGRFFSNLAFKANKIIAPVALVAIIACAVLQGFNFYGFTDSIGSNKNIADTFGRNDSIVVVYKTGEKEEDYKKEALLQSALAEYRNEEGKAPLASYTAYTTTVREVYDVDKAIKVIGLNRSDVEMLFTMYNLYSDKSALSMSTEEFIEFTNEMIATDTDVQNMINVETKNTVALIKKVGKIMSEEHTSGELYTLLKDASPSSTITDFSIKQMYGLYYYDKIENKNINARELLRYLVDNSDDLVNQGFIEKSKIAPIEFLLNIDKAIPNESLNGNYNYTDFTSFLNGLSSDPLDADTIQQLYIMYFYDHGQIPEEKMLGSQFVDFLLGAAETNSAIKAQVGQDLKKNLNDLVTVNDFLSDTAKFDYPTMCIKLNALQSNVNSVPTGTAVSEDMISGVYIKYAIANEDCDLTTPMMAFELVDFISENMRTNALLSAKMTEEHYAKIDDAKAMISGAEDLFIGEEHSRVLVGVVLPAEGEEMVSFIDYLLEQIHDIFGKDAHITGKVVSTYDLQAAFDVDNLIITLFTIIAILLVILIVFKSLSLPVILVAVIQGAVWISLSFCLIGGNLIFFMSYIVTNCILMGATVDYGILMSNNYIVYRKTMDKNEALKSAVDSAMPTVFTSGLILVVCGFVISLISSQNSIASVGSLLAQGTLVSIVMITVGLPSILYLLDKFILKFTLNKELSITELSKLKPHDLFAKIKSGFSELSHPIKTAVNDRVKKARTAKKRKQAMKKRAETIAAKKKAQAEAKAANEKPTAPRMTARTISKAIDEKAKAQAKERAAQAKSEAAAKKATSKKKADSSDTEADSKAEVTSEETES